MRLLHRLVEQRQPFGNLPPRRQCPAEQRCALPEQACVDGIRGCRSNSDCKENQLCNAGACQTAKCHVANINNPLHLSVCCPTVPVDCWQPATQTCECP